jgi:hypothetical protein
MASFLQDALALVKNMNLEWQYCRTNDTGLLLANGKVYRVPNLDAALELLDQLATEMTAREEEQEPTWTPYEHE